jgi:chromosome segregation ATPase
VLNGLISLQEEKDHVKSLQEECQILKIQMETKNVEYNEKEKELVEIITKCEDLKGAMNNLKQDLNDKNKTLQDMETNCLQLQDKCRLIVCSLKAVVCWFICSVRI